uniref:Uncharacterized protein n=1 Tax=Panagrolaimus sp. JU765 TaxID=591449 RepID=A0AC34RSF9_9BILA
MAIKNPEPFKPSKENAGKPMIVKNDPNMPPIPTPPQLTPEQLNEIKEFVPEQFFQNHKQKLRKIKNMTRIISIASICLLALVIILSILAIVLTIIEMDALEQFKQNVTGTNWYRDPCRLCYPNYTDVFKSQMEQTRVCFFDDEVGREGKDPLKGAFLP